MRVIPMTLTLMASTLLCGQDFTAVPSGTLDLHCLLNSTDTSTEKSAFERKLSRSNDSCTVKLDSFEISNPITAYEFQMFYNYYSFRKEPNWGMTIIDAAPTMEQREPVARITWVQATAYCQWLTDQQEQKDWYHRLPKLSEWLWAVQQQAVTEGDVGCWLMNTKDEGVWDCAQFDHFYNSIEGDPSPLRRKIVAFVDPKTHNTFGIYRNYWEFMSYPNVSFRVVKVKGVPSLMK